MRATDDTSGLASAGGTTLRPRLARIVIAVLLASSSVMITRPALAVQEPIYVGVYGGYRTYCNAPEYPIPCNGVQRTSSRRGNCTYHYSRPVYVSSGGSVISQGGWRNTLIDCR